jgi:hypothetical protein
VAPVHRRSPSPAHRVGSSVGWFVVRAAAAALVLLGAVTGLFAGCSSSSPSTTVTSSSATGGAGGSTSTSPSATAGAGGAGGSSDGGPSATADASPDAQGSNAHSPPSQGGTSGTVDSVSTPSFTLTTGAGEQVTVNEASSTTYDDATGPTSASAITPGQNVLVLGIVNSTTIAATQVTVLPSGINEAAASADAGVVPFQQGTPSAAMQVGQIPSYTEGQGTIVSGTTADQATESALAVYPGVVVDRVVLLSGGDYEVHCIGVNWPHHIFVDPSFTFVGAD